MKRNLIAVLLVITLVVSVSYSAPVKPYSDVVTDDTLTAAYLNDMFNTLYTWANGNITNANIASAAAIAGSKLAAGGVGTLQLADGSVAEVDLSATYTASLSAWITSSIATSTAGWQAADATITANFTAADASITASVSAHLASSTNPHGTNLTQTNASFTRLDVVGSMGTYGQPNTRFSFNDGAAYPMHWLGSINSVATSSVFYLGGPRSTAPTTWAGYDGWAIEIASQTGSTGHYARIYMPNAGGTAIDANPIRIDATQVHVQNRMVRGLSYAFPISLMYDDEAVPVYNLEIELASMTDHVASEVSSLTAAIASVSGSVPSVTPHGRELFNSNGSWVAPAGVTTVYATIVGGGGGGGGAASTTYDSAAVAAAGGGGGGGAYICYPITVTPLSTYTVTVGAGGTAGNTSGSAGGNGGDSTFGGVTGGGGAGGNGAIVTGPTGICVWASGGAGGSGAYNGCSGGYGAAHYVGSDHSVAYGGDGGWSGPGGAGGIGAKCGYINDWAPTYEYGTKTGYPGTRGSGGGGGSSVRSSTGGAGGAGGGGYVLLEW